MMHHNTANMMEAIQEDGDEYSLSGISLPSLDRMHFQEEHGIIPPDDDTTIGDEIDSFGTNNMEECISSNREGINESSQATSYDHDDGYPTDERTAPSFTQPKEKETKRQNILQLARDRLAQKKTDDIPREVSNTPEPTDDNDTFLGNAYAIDVENDPEDSSFLVDVGMDDAPDFASIGKSEHDTVDSYYDIHASTLSRASASTKASTIGDQILLESNIAAQKMNNTGGRNIDADSQSASTYSYRRAYVDNFTLGSNYTSTCSALTDDYCFDPRRTGMSEAIKSHDVEEDKSYQEDIKPAPSGPIDSDTGARLAQPSDCSHEESLARPPPSFLTNQPAEYENPEHLTTIVSFGEGEGYVDEEAARKYAALERENGGGCCGWFTSSSKVVKMVVLCSFLVCLISIASVGIALLLPGEEIGRTESSAKSSEMGKTNQGGFNDGSADDYSRQEDAAPTVSPTPAPSKTNLNITPSLLAATASATDSLARLKCEAGVQCFEEGSRCTDGRVESCCGETFDSFVCDCSNVNGKLEYTSCFYTDACFALSCETLGPSVSTKSPTRSPSKSPEALIYATSSITGTPTKRPSAAPTFEPPKRPTQLPTQLPTQKPSSRPTERPSQLPTDKPTTMIPTTHPTQRPTVHPTEEPTLHDTPIPTEAPIATAPTPTQELMQTVTLRATKDTYINASSPSFNYGAETRLRVDGSPRVWSFISFDMPSAINSIALGRKYGSRKQVQVIEAKLRLYTLDAGSGGIFFALPNANWAETSLTWNTMRQIDRSKEFQVGSMTWVSSFQWYEIDVSAAFSDIFTSDGVQNFLIKSDSKNGVAFASRERNSGSHSPELMLTFTSGRGNGMAQPIDTPTTPVPSPWPTYSPTNYDNTDPPTPKPSHLPSRRPTINPTTRKPSQPPSKRPTRNPTPEPTKYPSKNPTRLPTQKPSSQLITSKPTRAPTLEPSRRPTTRAPHKRPKRPTRSPTTSPLPTCFPTDFTGVKKHLIQPSLSPTGIQINPISFSDYVPPGCVAANDIHLALEQSLLFGQRNYNTHVVFPSQDGYIRGGVYSAQNYGSSDTLILDTTSKVLIEFDLGLIAVTSSIYNIVSITLRLFIDSVDDTISLSIFKLPQSVQWGEDLVTWEAVGNIPSAKVGPTFEVKSSDAGKWIDVDIINFLGGNQVDKFVLAMNNNSPSSEALGRCAFASRHTCHSSKLVVVTEEPI